LLGGITRRILLERVAPAAGVDVREMALRPADLPGMQECFLTSTTKDVAPVAAIDEQQFDVGAGSVARRLKASFAEYAGVYAQAHPELKLL
jgi:branched-chain amino acid aminotransferase